MPNKIVINNLADIPDATNQLLSIFPDSRIFAFTGEMGVGKTTLIKAICQKLGVSESITSPTFSIVNEYLSNNGIKIYHFDFYRLRSINEVYDLGYEDYFYSNAYCFIEWSEKITNLLPKSYISIKMTYSKIGREIEYSLKI